MEPAAGQWVEMFDCLGRDAKGVAAGQESMLIVEGTSDVTKGWGKVIERGKG